MMWTTLRRIPTRYWLALLALVALLCGCSDDKKTGDAQPGASGAAAPSGAAAAAPEAARPLAELEAPADVLVFGGADNFEQFAADVQKLAGEVSPLAAAPLSLGPQLQQALKLSSPDALDLTKPARFVLIDPKKNPEKPFALILGTKGKDKLVAALPPTKKENDAGNAYSWLSQTEKSVYLNFIGEHAVLTPNKDLFPATKGFLAQLIAAKLPSPVALVGSVKNAMALYATEFAQALQQAKTGIAQAAEAQGPAGAAPGMPNPAAQLAGATALIDWAAGAIKEVDRVVMTGALPADGATISFHLHPNKGSELEKTIQLLGKRSFNLLGKLPADSPAFLAMSIDPDSSGELTKRLMTWSLSLGMGGQAMPEKYLQASAEYWKATTGEMVFAAHSAVQGKGLSLTGLMGLRDPDKARASTKTMAEMYKEKSVADMYKALGIQVDFKEDAYKVGDVPVMTQQVKLGKALAKLGPFGPMLEDLLMSHVAHAKDMGVVAYGGKDGKPTIEAFLGGKVQGGLDQAPGAARALKNAAPGTFVLAYVSPVALVKGIHLGGQNPLVARLGDINAGQTGLALSIGAQGGVATVTLDVPTEQAKNVAQMVAKGQMP